MTTEQQPRSITEDELAEALDEIRKRNSADLIPVYAPDQTARAIIDVVERNREPEYEPGEIYRDPSGRVYLRSFPDGWLWLDPVGSGRPCLDGPVETPLRKLVPEGDLESGLRDLIATYNAVPEPYVTQDAVVDDLETLLGGGNPNV